jgi:hypothetical protein
VEVDAEIDCAENCLADEQVDLWLCGGPDLGTDGLVVASDADARAAEGWVHISGVANSPLWFSPEGGSETYAMALPVLDGQAEVPALWSATSILYRAGSDGAIELVHAAAEDGEALTFEYDVEVDEGATTAREVHQVVNVSLLPVEYVGPTCCSAVGHEFPVGVAALVGLALVRRRTSHRRCIYHQF